MMKRTPHFFWFAGGVFAMAFMMAGTASQAALDTDCTPSTPTVATDDPLPCVVSDDGSSGVNDDKITMQNALSIIGVAPVAVFDLTKLETSGSWSGGEETAGPLTVRGDASVPVNVTPAPPACTGTTCGTWDYSGSEEIVYLTVKAAKEFSIHSASEVVTSTSASASSGYWYTTLLETNSGGVPALSHLTVWAEMNEPLSLAVFGVGLAGVAWRRRRRAAAAA